MVFKRLIKYKETAVLKSKANFTIPSLTAVSRAQLILYSEGLNLEFSAAKNLIIKLNGE